MDSYQVTQDEQVPLISNVQQHTHSLETQGEGRPENMRQNGDIWISSPSANRYSVEMFDEGTWVPINDTRWSPVQDFDAARRVQGYQRVEPDFASECSLCGIYRNEQANPQSLYRQGYEQAYAYEQPHTVRYLESKFPYHSGHLTNEFFAGGYAARADYLLHHGEMWVSSDMHQLHPLTPVNLYLL